MEVRKVKKKVLVVLSVIVLLIVGVTAGVVMSGPKNPENLTTEEELVNYTEGPAVEFKGEVAVSADIPQETAKVVELTYELDDAITPASGKLIVRKLTLENKSDRSIERAEVSLKVLDDKGNELSRSDAQPFLNVGPGEIASTTGLTAFATANLDRMTNPKSFVITLESVAWVDVITTTPVVPSSADEVSPGEVVIAFFKAMSQGRYADAKDFLSSKSVVEYHKYLNQEFGQEFSTLEEALEAIPLPEKVEVLGSSVISGSEAEVKCDLGADDWTFKLVKENGEWKLVMP